MPFQAIKNRRPPCLREGVGGSIYAIRTGFSFGPCQTVKLMAGDPDMFFKSPVMAGDNWELSGVTRDSTGAPLGGCTVHLFYASNDQFISAQISDPTTGAFTFQIGNNAGPFYVTAYLAGTPDVAGTSLNTLLASVA